jgi:hypothetical protein
LVPLAACAAVLGFDDRSGTWCSLVSHAFCDDFDDSAFAAKWTAVGGGDGGSISPTASDASPPRALLAEALPITEGTGGAGLSVTFADRSSASSICVGFDVQVPTLEFGDAGPDAAPPPPTPSNPGFIDTAGFAGVTVADTVSGGTATIAITFQAQFGAGAPAMFHPLADSVDGGYGSMTLGGAPVDIRQWNHVELQFKPPNLFIQYGTQRSTMALPRRLSIQYPSVLIGLETFPPMGDVKMRFDDVTVDFDCVP